MKTLFIYNPHAGHVQVKNNLGDIVGILSSTYDDLNIYASRKSKDITNYLKKNASNYELVIVSGGDGSLSEAINGLMASKTNVKLGYIPAGSTNDYAASLKLPKNIVKCAELIANSKETNKIDIGKFNSNYFVYVAAFGAFTEVAYSTSQDVKNVLGHMAYLLNGITSLSNIKSYKLKIKTSDNEYNGRYLYGMITNTLSIGGIYKFNSKKVKLDDGKFEVMLIKKPSNLLELNEITAALIDSRIKSPLVEIFTTDKLTIESSKDLSFTLDGEYGGSYKKIKIENINKAIKIIK